MKIRSLPLLLVVSSLLFVPGAPYRHPALAAPAHATAPGAAIDRPGRSPLLFVANVGQLDTGARFQVRGASTSMFLADDALWLTIVDPHSLAASQRPAAPASPPALAREQDGAARPPALRGVNIRLSFVGANPHPRIEAFDRLDAHLSYFRGDASKWRADVPAWGGVRYHDLYPGIDLELNGAHGQLDQRLRVRPGANLGAVRMRVEGADRQLSEGGRLLLQTGAGNLAVPLPQVESSDGAPLALADARPIVVGDEISAPFAAAPAHDPIAPQSALGVEYATFLGGEFDDYASALAVDASGAAYVTGSTFSPTFPDTPGAFDQTCGTDPAGKCNYDGSLYYYDAFVAKLNPAGTDLVYATFIGGQAGDFGQGIAVDSTGAAYVTGYTYSPDFFPNAALAGDLRRTGAPSSVFAARASRSASTASAPSANAVVTDDAFAVKLNATGTQLLYNQRLFSKNNNGDANYDEAYDIAIDAAGNAYLTGLVGLDSFDGFVAKLDNTGSLVNMYGGFFGGANNDWGNSIAIDGNNNIYMTGQTQSPDFPTIGGGYDEKCGSDGNCDFDGTNYYYDAFAVKINAAGTALLYTTFLGGNNGDGGYGIAVDASGSAYITGFTYSASGFPITPGAYDSSFGGVDDGFVVKLNPAGSSLVYATFLGTADGDNGRSIAVDAGGSAYVAGLTFSSSFPTTVDAFDADFNGADDAFVVKLDPAGAQLTYATYLGGDSTDEAYDIALNGSDMVYVAGLTSSATFPVSQSAYDRVYAGNTCGADPDSHPCYDAFVVKLAPSASPAPQRTRVFLALAVRIAGAAAPSICDAFEPNDNRRDNPPKLEIGQAAQAGICPNDEDNYAFDIVRNAKPTITVDLPPTLRGKTLVWVYDQAKPGTTICGNGSLAAAARISVSNCAVLAPGRYIVRLYTDNSATDFDKQNPYTLLITA